MGLGDRVVLFVAACFLGSCGWDGVLDPSPSLWPLSVAGALLGGFAFAAGSSRP